MDSDSKRRYERSKCKVKKWESEFKKENGVLPTKVDIKMAPTHIREAYKTYWTLKTLALETNLVDVVIDESTQDALDTKTILIDLNTNSDTNVTTSSTLEFCTAIGDASLDNSLIDRIANKSSQPNGENCISVTSEANEKNRRHLELDSKEQCTRQNKESVWGPHLNKKPSGKVLVTTVQAHQYTAKLFAGSKFNKRNPRKSICRKSSDSLSQPTRNFNNSDILMKPDESILDCSQSSQSPYEKENLDSSNISVLNDAEKTSELSQNLLSEKSITKITCNTPVPVNQPISILQKTLFHKSDAKQLTPRSFDRGWIDRITKQNSLENQQKLKGSESEIKLNEKNKNNSGCLSAKFKQSTNVADSDEDFVYDSDLETEECGKVPNYSQLSGKRGVDNIEPTEHAVSKKSKIDLTEGAKRDKCEYNNGINMSINDYFSEVKKPLDYSESRLSKVKKIRTRLTEREILKKKVESGKANENFVRINIKKKVYARGKKTMTFLKYKKQKWKAIKKAQNNDKNFSTRTLLTCFKCGDIGHMSRNCLKVDKLLPKEDFLDDEEQESLFPTLEEAEKMARDYEDHTDVRKKLATLQSQIKETIPDGISTCVPEVGIIEEKYKKGITEPLLQTNDDGTLIDTPPMVFDALSQFKHTSFRNGQEKAIMRILSGISTLVTLSTGSGKSLCYQLPAYLYAKYRQCITLVVSPLISLMEDQVAGVNSVLKMACLHTNQSEKQRALVIENLKNNSLDVLLVSPEAVVGDRSNGDSNFLQYLPPVAFACIDEAHCVSQWSHNFRPSYLMVCQVLKEKLGIQTILGLTATATVSTIQSIAEHLGISDGINGVVSDTPLPDNLVLSVSSDKNRDAALISLLSGPRFSTCESVIIYCTRREECERLASYIRTSLQDVRKEDGLRKRGKLSWNAESYHAGRSAAKRKKVQNAFMSGKLRIVVATVAFGMGINKNNVRGVIHYNMPRSFESYVQEVGRAGRDGLPAHCHVFLDSEGQDLNELRRHIYANSVERHVVRKLLQRVFVKCHCEQECPKHEVAFTIEQTVTALDLPLENISTLLCYLELHPKKWIKVLSPAYTLCKIHSYRGTHYLKLLSRKCPPLAMAIAMKKKTGEDLEKMSHLEIPVIQLAADMNWDSGIVKHSMKDLEWTKVNNKSYRSGITVQFLDLGFRVLAPGNLTSEQLDEALDSLYNHVYSQEVLSLKQLHAVFKAFTEVSCDSVDECLESVNTENSEILKQQVRSYFSHESQIESTVLPEPKLENEDKIISDIHTLITSYPEQNFTGRSMARIFHGIASPNFPAVVWGRCLLWRAHMNQDFNLLSKLATQELLRLR